MDYLKEFLARAGISLSKFIRAKIIATALSFLVVLIGFFFLDIPYWGLVALLIAIVDLLPFLGAGLILIPWSLLALVQNNKSLALGLLVLFFIVFIIHQVLEPIIVGKEVGLKPLYSFLIMTLSIILLGPWGALVGSLATVVLSTYLSMRDYPKDQ